MISRAQQGVIGALRSGHAKLGASQPSAVVLRPSKAAFFAPHRCVAVRSRKASTVTAAANGNGLTIDLRGEQSGLAMPAFGA
jgi:hypothetical protein